MCEYCEKEKPIVNGKEWTINIENKYGEKELYIEMYLGGYESIREDTYVKIEYCPMCGKKLKEYKLFDEED